MAVSSSRRVASPVFESLDLTPLAEFDCVLLRGSPGSGKSTLAQALAARHGFVHLEADGPLSVAGVYRFDPATGQPLDVNVMTVNIDPVFAADRSVEGIMCAAIDISRIRSLESEQRRLPAAGKAVKTACCGGCGR